MIKRVFKTIFILSLCLGVTLPANAGGVQVSDGSAFVTKSEMSYQLNSLSNRMAQLENSLDSKIDKLVSSYLTRNGIWNGAKQNVTDEAITIEPFTITLSSNKASGKYTWFTKTMVESINKSGMYSGYYAYRDPNSTGTAKTYWRWGYMGDMIEYGKGRAINGMNVCFNVKVDGTSTILYSGQIFGIVGSVDTNTQNTRYALFASIPWSVMYVPIKFFVNKGDKLLWEVYADYHMSLVSSIGKDNGSYNAFQIWLEPGYVY